MRERNWIIGAWNVRSLTGKENELIGEFESVGIDILGITETKKKGKGEVVMKGGHVLMYSGVDLNQRAKEGVGCIVRKENMKYVRGWTGISERILKIELELDEQTETTIIVVYGPNEDETATRKDHFWEQLNEITEESKGRLIIIGDVNGRVGRRDEETGDVIGIHGEEIRNNNGWRLIDFCMMNNLIVTNTFYAHKDIHKYTREIESRRERSIIDYAIINRQFRAEVKDTRVRRGPEIYSDHFLVTTKIGVRGNRQGNHEEAQASERNNTAKEVIKTYRLQEEETANRYREKIGVEMKKIKDMNDNTCLENLWRSLRDTIIKIARETCGSTRAIKTKKQTRWWNEEIKREVKIKKQRWQSYLRNRNDKNYDNYREQRIRVRELVKKAKQQSWEEFGRKMEQDSYGNQKLFYKVLKNLRKGKQSRSKYIKAKDGRILCGDDEILSRWKEHFENILNKNQPQHGVDLQEREEGVENSGESGDREITVEEVMEAMRRLKRGKTAGHDGITTEMVKNLDRNGVELLTQLFNLAWKNERIPRDWELGMILPIHKKGDNKECMNYRGITIMSVMSKLYERILEKRLKEVVEGQLEEPQSGFRKGRSVQDHIFTIKQLVEKNTNNNIYLAFIDLEKAFDSVPRKIVWNSLRRRGVAEKLRNNIICVYRTTRNCIRTGNLQSEEFITREGLRQGGVLSPTLFNIVMDDILKETKEKVKKLLVGYRNMERVTISECAFADDLVIFAKSEQDLQHSLDVWKKALQDRNLKINTDKTKVMVVGKGDEKISITLDGRKIDQSETYNYLGVKVHKGGKNEAELTGRVESALRLYHSLNNTFIRKKEISTKTKMTVYSTVFKPILTYGSESWILTNQMRSRIQATEMKYLRGVKGITRRDKVRNETVRQELKVEPIIRTIERQQLKWLGHMVRMDEERQPKRVWQARAAQKRARGRPRRTWNETVAESLRERGLTWSDGRKMAANRKEWAKFVYS